MKLLSVELLWINNHLRGGKSDAASSHHAVLDYFVGFLTSTAHAVKKTSWQHLRVRYRDVTSAAPLHLQKSLESRPVITRVYITTLYNEPGIKRLLTFS